MMDCKDKLPQKDKEMWQNYIYKNQSIFDKAIRWFNHESEASGAPSYH
jgi:hypothetical protein